MFTYLFIGVAVLLVVFLIVASQRPDDLHVVRSLTISAPAALVFAEVNDLSKWQEISPYVKDDPALKYKIANKPLGVGASLDWAGNAKVGTGRITITESVPHELVRYKFEFFKPWYCTNQTDFILHRAGSSTEVTWDMTMKNNFIAKASGMLMNMDKLMGESFEAGLVNLKNLAEAAAKK